MCRSTVLKSHWLLPCNAGMGKKQCLGKVLLKREAGGKMEVMGCVATKGASLAIAPGPASDLLANIRRWYRPVCFINGTKRTRGPPSVKNRWINLGWLAFYIPSIKLPFQSSTYTSIGFVCRTTPRSSRSFFVRLLKLSPLPSFFVGHCLRLSLTRGFLWSNLGANRFIVGRGLSSHRHHIGITFLPHLTHLSPNEPHEIHLRLTTTEPFSGWPNSAAA